MAQPQSQPGRLEELAEKDIWILDLDGFLYRNDSQFAQGLFAEIAANFNEMATQNSALQTRLEAQLNRSQLKQPGKITADDLGIAYVPMIKTLIDIGGPQMAETYLDWLYGYNHDQIVRDENLAAAFEIATAKNIRIFINTNSPRSHVRYSLSALGVAPAIVADLYDNTFDIANALAAGRQKHDPHSFVKDFFPFAGIDDPSKAFMGDDGVKHLRAAAQAGLSTLWAWTSDEEPKAGDVQTAADINAVRVSHTGEALLKIAEMHRG